MSLNGVIERVCRDIRNLDSQLSTLSEADAKREFIDPVLNELGWYGFSRVRLEYGAQTGMRMDYALLGGDSKPVALIEAKAPREDLDRHVMQPLTYAFQEGVDICVLSTGVQWWLYLPREKGNPAERRFAALDLKGDDITKLAAIFESCLEYEALTSGAAEKRAKEILVTQQREQRVRKEIPRAWQRLLAGPNDLLVELLQEEAEQALGFRPSKEQVAESLGNYTRGRSDSTVAAPALVHSQRGRSARASQPQQDELPQKQARRVTSPTSSPRSFRLWGDVHRFKNWTDLWLSVAAAVYERHEADFYQRVQASSKMRGRSRVYIQDSVIGMHTPVRIENSPYYAETNNSKSTSLRLARDLIATFDYGNQDLEVILEK